MGGRSFIAWGLPAARGIASKSLALAALALVWLPAAHAARLALVIGNAGYVSAGALKNPISDAQLMRDTLAKAGYNVTFKKNLGRHAMWDAIDEFRARISKGDEVIFYYAGHGAQVGSNPILLPIDIVAENMDQVDRDSVRLFEVQAAFQDAKVALFIIDACRNNPFGDTGNKRLLSSFAAAQAPTETMPGNAIIMAASHGETALDEVPGVTSDHGLFTYEFVETASKYPGANLSELLRKVRDRVSEVGQSLPGDQKHQQRPAIAENISGDFYIFASTDPNRGAQLSVEDEAWSLCRNAQTPLPCTSYLKAHPDGRYASLAQTRLADLQAATRGAGVAIVAAGGRPIAAGKSGEFRECDKCPEMMTIPAGRLLLASAAPTTRAITTSEVPFNESFAVGRYEVTFDEWDACHSDGGCASTPSDEGWGRGRQPVVNVSWQDAQDYVTWLSRKTGARYRLLRDAEWEYVASAGAGSRFPWGDVVGAGNANCNGCGAGSFERHQTARVGTFRENAFHLYDVIGNAWEWVEECYTPAVATQPAASTTASGSCRSRILRGGSFQTLADDATVHRRREVLADLHSNQVGFRVARDLH
jgi:formylglycine-generating enzyme required for sulfatase activity